MFKIVPKLQLLSKYEAVNFTKYELVRFRKRKPIHLGTAKSKLFRIPERPNQPEEERMELLRIFNNYRTTMKSLRNFFIVNHSSEFVEASEDPEESRRLFEEDFKRCSAINDQWNKNQKERREKFFAKQHEEEVTFALNRIELEKKKAQELQEAIEEIVRKEKEECKTIITPDMLDKAIEYALANPVDYNFALESNGEKIIGRNTKPSSNQEDKIVAKQ
ncbi:unnamed protein product [Phyllotreta striolata]|uniref:Small ribosomal subunit protein mS26 n=1 Tax=Phyllotreta striolata TaxID=444603 RepID=A0A9N9XS26_PHYSR|nr:unnamed protein product [Phyllotreta striolata]